MSDATSNSANQKYAWREIVCQGLPARDARKRAADFAEIHALYDEKTAREQASRCVQCPNPSCVSGCPLCNPIPGWMQLTAEGRFLEAAALLASVTNMAEICTRVCPSDHLCEESCILSGVSEPVSIRALEQFLIDYSFQHGEAERATPPPNGRKVAVVGSGPGGLACAEELIRRGYSVTIYDSEPVPGGLLVNGIPAFRLEAQIVQRRVDLLQQRGVKFQLNAKLWDEVSLSEIREKYDAVYLGFDSRKARTLGVPGVNLRNIVQAVPFLLQNGGGLGSIDLKGKSVVVLGAGDTAMDCARAAIRLGARDATCVYRREQIDMSCGRNEYRAAVEEGAQFVFNSQPVEFVGDAGAVKAVRFARRDSVSLAPGQLSELPADLVVLALGFEPAPCPLKGGFEELARTPDGLLVVDDDQMTNLKGVYAGGDLVEGPTTLLYAIRDARKAAERMHLHLLR